MILDFQREAEVLYILNQAFQFPDSYLVLDLETTGFSRKRDYIVDFGWAIVENNRVTEQGSILADWSQVPSACHRFIQSQLERQADNYAKMGRPHYYSWERLCHEGENPLEAMHAYTTRIYDYLKHSSNMIVGHGLWRFDRSMLDSHTREFMNGYELPWRWNSVFDTGLLEKACQADLYPWPGDTLDQWLDRVEKARPKGVKWNLEQHSVAKYFLDRRYCIDMRQMHTAGFDCILIHYLFDTYRQLTEIIDGKRQELENIPA